MPEIKGSYTCTDCGHTFKWKLVLRARMTSGVYPVTVADDDEVLLNTSVQEINGVDCYDCYCPNCGMPLYIPCSSCSTET